ncbi:MAG: FAD-binding protein, partial [Actinobacteria bacterium]|nr:FAD-binding protein [Actinomycetota bacterium]
MTVAGSPAAAELAAALRQAGVAEVSGSTLERALYSSDGSLYRVVPAVVAHPRDTDEVAAAVGVCRALGIPLTCRGAGTSIAGNAVGAGLVLNFSKHLNRVLAVDKEARTATVEPGVVQAQLQRAVAGAGLRFGPDPSTSSRCTIGGMTGNNSCGSRSLRYGRTADNVAALEAVTAAGRPLRLGDPGGSALPGELAGLREVVAGGLATIRTEFGRFPRQVSGYGLEHLLPERGFDVRRALVGSEGTLAVVTQATLQLVSAPRERVLVALGYPDMPSAAEAVPGILECQPATCEGLDSRIVDVVRARRGPAAIPALPRGSGWLLAEVTGGTAAEALAQARQVAAAAGALAAEVISDPRQAAALWRIREDGAGLSGRTPAGRPAYPGWEDSAVPPGSLGPYLRDLDELLAGHELSGAPYGHFGEGCLHLRLDFPLTRQDGPAVLRAFLTDAARLVARYGGSLSGEHGDGRCRSELLPVMYSPAALALMGKVKHVFDPDGLLNPGVITSPVPVDADLRESGPAPARGPVALAYRGDGGDFAAAVHRCSGVGRCVTGRAGVIGAGAVMCPSYLATGNEKDSTRGRARVLQEMINGSLVTGGWRAPEVRSALDLCLACKACSAECPAGVDMASYKAEVLHQAYRHRPRPRSHYALGWLPRWAGLASLVPGLANGALAAPGLGRAARFAAGVDQRRDLPSFAPRTFRSWFARRAGRQAGAQHPGAQHPWRPGGQQPGGQQAGPGPGQAGGRTVLLLADTFTNYFDPEVGIAAAGVLESAGYQVTLPRRRICCGLTWISTGQLTAARRVLRRTVAELAPAVAAGIPVVGLEPSCTAVLRSDAAELLGSPEAEQLAASVRTLGELLTGTEGWQPPRLDGTPVVAQPHCHHSAVLGWDTDAGLLRRAGANLTRVGGCCGLAGNFGAERGHYEVSVAVAETALLPAVRAAAPDAVLLADGFSCRTQLAGLAGRTGIHLA